MIKIIVAILFVTFNLSSGYYNEHEEDLFGDKKLYEAKEAPSKDDFVKWSIVHGKEYNDAEEMEKKFKTYLDNHFLVEKLNQIYFGQTEFALNQFADLTPEEFKSKILISNLNKPFNTPESKYLPPIDMDELPDSFDWRSLGTVTPVKDQGQVGSCWAFSAAQNLEGQYALKTKKLINLSVEQIVDCDGHISGEDYSDCGVYGGWPYLAFEYVKSIGGIETEDDYPYCCGTGKCLPCSPPGYNKTECGPPVPFCRLADSCQAKFDSSKTVPDLKVIDWMRTSLNETDIALQLMNRGPLSVALNAELLQFYFGGVFNPFDSICNAKNLNHAVLMVGWGIDNSRIFGKRPYWIVKNSWGKSWGEKGYFRIIRGKGKCGINSQCTTAILE